MMGTPSSSLPPVSQSSVSEKEVIHVAPKVTNSQSTMAMSSLVPLASVGATSEWTGDSGRKIGHSRSISEPDFGRTTKQMAQAKSQWQVHCILGALAVAVAEVLFRRLLVGCQDLIIRQNWVNQTSSIMMRSLKDGWKKVLLLQLRNLPFHHRQKQQYSKMVCQAFKGKSITQTEMPDAKLSGLPEHNSGIPPMAIPPSQNQFSARCRVGVRSRYVDTFNKGCAVSTPPFQCTTVPPVKPIVGSKLLFFVPTTPVTLIEQITSNQGATIDEEPTTSVPNDAAFSSPVSSATLMQRFPSMDNLTPYGNNIVRQPLLWAVTEHCPGHMQYHGVELIRMHSTPPVD